MEPGRDGQGGLRVVGSASRSLESHRQGCGAPTGGSGGGREPSPVWPARVEGALVWPVDESEAGVPFAGTAVRQGAAGSAVWSVRHRTVFPRASAGEGAG